MIERRRFLLTLGVIVAAGGMGWWFTPDPHALPKGGPFTLQSASGPVSLDSLRGRVVLLYFGYASCPDVCPTALGLVGSALRTLTPDELAKVRVVFVSLDPERDTPATLAPYAAHFHPSIVGVTGTVAEVADVARRYGVTFRKHGVESAVGYVVDHTSHTIVVDPDGKLVEVLEHGTPPDDIVAAIRRYTPAATAAPTATAAETVQVSGAVVRAPAPGTRVTAAYLTLTNSGPMSQALVRAASPVAEAVELHAVLTEDGMTSMRPVDRVEIPAGGAAKLEPSGNHVMLIGVTSPLGPTVPLTLTFADGSSVTVDATVREDL